MRALRMVGRVVLAVALTGLSACTGARAPGVRCEATLRPINSPRSEVPAPAPGSRKERRP